MEIILILTVLLVAATIGAGTYVFRKKSSRTTTFRILGASVSAFIFIMIGAAFVVMSGYQVAAQEAVTTTAEAATTVVAASGITTGEGLKYLGAALSTGLACIGTGTAVASAAAAAIGAISEDPKLLGRTIIFVGLSEGIAIYGLIISIMILG